MFGTLLLDDNTGRRVDNIKVECLGNPVTVACKILQEWLEGKGLPVTWQSLIQTLRDTELSELADQIQKSVTPLSHIPKRAKLDIHTPVPP